MVLKDFAESINSADHDGTECFGCDGEAVMVLSAPPTVTATGYVEDNEENVARIRWGIVLAKHQAISGAGAEWFDELPDHISPGYITDEDFPLLYLNGETEQLGAMVIVAKKYYPHSRIRTINCGDRGVGNTLTQFKVIAETPELISEFQRYSTVTVVTSACRVPRVVYTAMKWLGGACRVIVQAVPLLGDICFPISLDHIKAELDQITRDVPQGDIDRP